jgi:tRNA 2-thiouridine synthesizing protein A
VPHKVWNDVMQIDQELDTRGLNCPLPILKAKKALNGMQSGQLLKVISTDQGSLRDFAAFAKQTGNELMAQQTVGNEFIHTLKRR